MTCQSLAAHMWKQKDYKSLDASSWIKLVSFFPAQTDKLQWKLYQHKKSWRQLMPLTSASCWTANQEKQINKICFAKQSFWKENIFHLGSPGKTGHEREELHSVCFANSSCAIWWPCSHWAPQTPPSHSSSSWDHPKIQNYTGQCLCHWNTHQALTLQGKNQP